MKKKRFVLKRLLWYFIGFILFYSPAALFGRTLSFFTNTESSKDIHDTCLRCGILGITGSIKMDLFSIRIIITLLLLVSAFFAGPVFCRLFCAAGAINEYLNKIIPHKLKLDWQKYINPVPVKYGILTGFLLTPFLGFSVACSYCNFSLMQRMILGLGNLDFGVLSSTNILTLATWLIIFGIFSKGGRAYCSYLCPVGAVQSLVYSIGNKFKYKLLYKNEKCSRCGSCIEKCPMGAIKKTDEGIKYNIHNCITCKQCSDICPTSALAYGAISINLKNLKLCKFKESEKKNEIH